MSNMKSKQMVFIFLLSFMSFGMFISHHFLTTDWLEFQEESLCACEECSVKHQQVLNISINSSVQPFLFAKQSLSGDAFHWWKGIYYERYNFSVYKETVEKIFEIFPRRPDLAEPSPDRCRTCAVVGNSVNLKGSHYGPLIDNQDVVIRMNTARIKGYEVDVGNKTTHHIMYPESAVHLDNTTHLILFPFKLLDLQWLIKAFSSSKSKIKANKDLVMVLNPAFMMYVHDEWLHKKGRYSSTGFMALILALHVCDEVHVFGFGADSNGSWSHYWEKLKSQKFKTGPHPGDLEFNIIQQLAENKLIQYYKGQ